MANSYDPTTPRGQVRLLLNDVDVEPGSDGNDEAVFTDEEIDAILSLEGGHVKLAAAQLIDTNASNEVLASKVLRSQDWQTDGAKVADAMRKHADRLREQHAAAVDAEDDGFFDIVEAPGRWPELTERPAGWW